MGLLTAGAWWVWKQPADYHLHLEKTDAYYQQGLQQESLVEAGLALGAMEEQLPLATKMAELQPTGEHQSELAYLIYRHSQYVEFVLPSLRGETIGRDHSVRHGLQVESAIRLLETAVGQRGTLGQLGAEQISPEFARQTLAQWREVAARCRLEGAVGSI